MIVSKYNRFVIALHSFYVHFVFLKDLLKTINIVYVGKVLKFMYTCITDIINITIYIVCYVTQYITGTCYRLRLNKQHNKKVTYLINYVIPYTVIIYIQF